MKRTALLGVSVVLGLALVGLVFFLIPKNQIVFDGNSMTDGEYSIYPRETSRRLGLTWQSRNFGVSGQTTKDMLLDASSQIDPLVIPGRQNILVVWEGTNDIKLGAPCEDAYTRIVDYAKGRKTAGFTVLILSILPRSKEGVPETFEKDRQACNEKLRDDFSVKTEYEYLFSANGIDYADYLVDVAADQRIGDFGDDWNTAYYYDKTHMTDAGYKIIADHVVSSVFVIP